MPRHHGGPQPGGGGTAVVPSPPLPLPHETDQSLGQAGDAPRKQMDQARRDLDAGQVDTDLHATPGLDAERLKTLVTPVKPPPEQDCATPASTPSSSAANAPARPPTPAAGGR